MICQLLVNTMRVGHVPQLALREAPQLSVPAALPHDIPSCEQNAASLSGTQHALPQLTVLAAPQLSVPLALPHAFPSREQNVASLSGVHAQAPCKQLCPLGHAAEVVAYEHAPVAALHVPGVTPVTRSPFAAHVSAGG